MRDPDTLRALRQVNRPPKSQPCLTDIAVLLLALVILFIIGKEFGTPLLQSLGGVPVAQVQTVVGGPSLTDEEKLLLDAISYKVFWERWKPRRAAAAPRYGWTKKESEEAVRQIRLLKPHFEAARRAFEGWGTPAASYELLEREINELHKQLSRYCEKFGLICPRGVPPDEAPFKGGVKPAAKPPGKQIQGAFSFSIKNAI